MTESISIPDERQDALELGEMLGRRRTYGTIAGRCSAADAESVRRIREQKLYLQRSRTWEDFCPKYLGMSKQHADRIIRTLEELGSEYFELAQLTHVTQEQFRPSRRRSTTTPCTWVGKRSR